MARIGQVLAGEKTWGRYAVDLLGHSALGAAFALPATIACVLSGQIILALLLGSIMARLVGLVRERIQYLRTGKLHLDDRLLDIMHHELGAPIALGIVLVVRAWL